MKNKCVSCKEPFSDENVYSDLGWKEVQISGLCELCFDKIKEYEDEDDLFFSENGF